MHAHHPGGILSVTHRARLLEDLPPPPWIVLRTHRRGHRRRSGARDQGYDRNSNDNARQVIAPACWGGALDKARSPIG